MALSTAEHERWELDAHGMRYTDPFGRLEELRKEGTIDTIKDPGIYAGSYVSDDAETTLTASVIDGRLVLKRRPDTIIALTGLYPGAFSADHGLGTVIFHWDAGGRPSELSVVQDRVWDMRFAKVRSR
jgi:hypothetical protein